VKKIKAVRGIRVLLASWDEPWSGDVAYQRMDESLAYLQKIHDAAIAASAQGTNEPMEIAKRTAALLGLPPQVVTPLLARTLQANIRVRDQRDLSAIP
jgi:hypothetical protein